ncbi:MAG: PspC domain-containing protein [Prevotella sp.]|nr:PspC domain-containing protein [Prevotella sp.]
MKKNITINLCGRLFNIDEDAYELLRNYIETLRSYFMKQEGGEEIADDLEQRVGELLEELKNQGVEAINIDHVKEVISRLGKPEEMESEIPGSSSGPENKLSGRVHLHEGTADDDASEEKEKKNTFSDFMEQLSELFRERRFYRNPKDKMLAGVISGLASSFEVDVTLLRLLFVAVAILLGAIPFPFFHYWHMGSLLFMVLVYALMALIMPEAETPEQQLKMQGKTVNVQTLAEEVVQNVNEKADDEKKIGRAKSVLNGFLKFLVSCFKFLMVILALALFFGGLFAILYGLFAIHSPNYVDRFLDWEMTPILQGNLNIFVAFLIALLAVLFIPAYAILQHLVRPLKIYQRLALILVWLVALAATVVTGIMLTQICEKYYNETHISSNADIVTENGITMKLYEYEFLSDHRWTILNGEGCNERFTAQGEYYINNRGNARYLDCYDEMHSQRYRAERTDTLMPGRYKLSVAARANGKGAFVYLLIDGKKQLKEIPATGNTGGSIWQEAVDSINQIRVATQPGEDGRWEVPDYIHEIAIANNGDGFGWNRIVFEPFVITKPNTAVSYGLSSDPAFTGQTWLGQYFSACDFIIERVEEGSPK